MPVTRNAWVEPVAEIQYILRDLVKLGELTGDQYVRLAADVYNSCAKHGIGNPVTPAHVVPTEARLRELLG